MVRVLKVPSEKFRDKIAKSVRGWVTSLKKELGYVPSVEQIKKLLVEGYMNLLGVDLIPSSPTDLERGIWEQQVKPRHISREWLYMPEFRHEEILKGRIVKIAADVKIVEVIHKAGKLIRVTAELSGNKILDILISGDFFMMPESALPKLESNLKGAVLSRDEILKIVYKFFMDYKVQTPGLCPEDFANAIIKLRELA
jgi:lipoate-protein ligase A